MEKLNVLLLGDDDRQLFAEVLDAGNIDSDITTISDCETLENYLALQLLLPDVLFMKITDKNAGLNRIADLRKDSKYDNVIIVAYTETADDGLDEKIFLAGANVFLTKTGEKEFRKTAYYIIGVIWQYIADGFNKETFMMMIN